MPFDYAPAPESRSIVDIESNYGLFIGGSFSEPSSGEFFKTINPATEEVLSEVAEAGQADGAPGAFPASARQLEVHRATASAYLAAVASLVVRDELTA